MTALELLESLNLLDENEHIEAKQASEAGQSILETICVFANEPGLGGGWRRLGVVCEEMALFPAYEVEGIAQPEKLGTEIATQCRNTFNQPVRAEANPDAEELRWSDEDLLQSLGCIRRNPGFSLKSPDHLGEPGSQLRNPKIAAALYDTRLAKTKGSGIRVMRESMEQAGLTRPLFESDRGNDQFVARYFFHHFVGAEDIAWLTQFKDLPWPPARALIANHARPHKPTKTPRSAAPPATGSGPCA